MTPEIAQSWLLPIAIAFCIACGVAVVFISVRTGWSLRTVTWAMVSFACVGAVMILSPKWSTFAIEWGELKAQVARLEEQNGMLASENAEYVKQINEVSQLASFPYKSAGDLVTTIRTTRENVGWADFLPVANAAYGLEVKPENGLFSTTLSGATNAAEVYEAMEKAGFKVIKPATEDDLRKSPPNELWVMPTADNVGTLPLKQ